MLSLGDIAFIIPRYIVKKVSRYSIKSRFMIEV